MNTKPNFFEGSFMAQMLGPLFLIPVLMLAGKYNPLINCDLLAIAALGLLLCATKQTRGCAYALVLLALSASLKHLFFDSHHVFQACLESSVAFSLIITSLVFTESSASRTTLCEQLEKKTETIQFLEEDLSKQRETTAEESAISNNRLTTLQDLVEETQNELSAVQMLNGVLRKTTAKAVDHGTNATSQLISSEARAGLLLEEIDTLQRELHRLSNENNLVGQNGELFKELNAARFKETQTHLINETLARMLAGQAEKVQELENQTLYNKELQEKIYILEKNQSNIDPEILLKMEQELREKAHLLEQLSRSNQELQEELAIAIEKGGNSQILQEMVALKTEELDLLSSKYTILKTQVVEQKEVEHLQENLSKRLSYYVETEGLYRQLREQFAEKEKMLHQTRSQLFLAETELQRLDRLASEKNLHNDPMPPALRREFESLEEEKATIVEENQILTDLVSELMNAKIENEIHNQVETKLVGKVVGKLGNKIENKIDNKSVEKTNSKAAQEKKKPKKALMQPM